MKDEKSLSTFMWSFSTSITHFMGFAFWRACLQQKTIQKQNNWEHLDKNFLSLEFSSNCVPFPFVTQKIWCKRLFLNIGTVLYDSLIWTNDLTYFKMHTERIFEVNYRVRRILIKIKNIARRPWYVLSSPEADWSLLLLKFAGRFNTTSTDSDYLASSKSPNISGPRNSAAKLYLLHIE